MTREQAEEQARAFCEQFADEFVMQEAIIVLTEKLLANQADALEEAADEYFRWMTRPESVMSQFSHWLREQAAKLEAV